MRKSNVRAKRTVEAGAGWPRKDDTNFGLERPDGGCRSGSALERGVRPHSAAVSGAWEADVALSRSKAGAMCCSRVDRVLLQACPNRDSEDGEDHRGKCPALSQPTYALNFDVLSPMLS